MCRSYCKLTAIAALSFLLGYSVAAYPRWRVEHATSRLRSLLIGPPDAMQRKKLDFAEELTYIEELYQRRAFIEAADCLTDMLSQPAVYSRWGAVLLLPDLEEGATVALPRIDALIADPATPELVRQDAVTAKELIIVRLRQRKLIPEAAETKPGQTSEL